jgi:hypothetical protein
VRFSIQVGASLNFVIAFRAAQHLAFEFISVIRVGRAPTYMHQRSALRANRPVICAECTCHFCFPKIKNLNTQIKKLNTQEAVPFKVSHVSAKIGGAGL